MESIRVSEYIYIKKMAITKIIPNVLLAFLFNSSFYLLSRCFKIKEKHLFIQYYDRLNKKKITKDYLKIK